MKDVEFIFDEQWLNALLKLKQALTSSPIMQPSNWSLPFEIMCDAIDYTLGTMLCQKKDMKMCAI